MQIIRMIKGEFVDNHENNSWVGNPLELEVVNNYSRDKSGSSKTLIDPSNEPYIINIWITRIGKEREILHSFNFMPDEWRTLIKKSKTDKVELGFIKEDDGEIKAFYLESKGTVVVYLHFYGFKFQDKNRYYQRGIDPAKWKVVQISSATTPVQLFKELDEKTDEEYFYYLYKGTFYISEIDMTPEDVRTVLENTRENKKEKLTKELERVKARAEFTGYTREPIPEDVQIMVWNRDQGKCVKCGSSINLEFDHIIPVSKGGSNTARNIQLLCEKCNRTKSASIGG